MNERSVFLAALEIDNPEHRAAYLRDACGGDAGLLRNVKELLDADAAAGSFMDAPAVTIGSANSDTLPDSPISLSFLAASDELGSLGRLGSYEITRVIGQGGMGIVLEGRDTRLERVVAVKVLAPQLAVTAAARQRFHREAKAAAAIRDVHVVTIYAVEEASGVPYLVMELIAGLSLQERIDRDGPLALAEILRIGEQTARGLAAAHAHGLIHRDVKPANILLENGVERVKLTDFGLARVADDASLTQGGVIAGTPQYMAPEQARGESVDHRADLFSLGSVFYAMCTGRPPFRASTTMGVLKRVCEEPLSPIREINPDIPEWLVALIDKLHAKDPAERYQSAAEVADLLSQHLSGRAGGVSPLSTHGTNVPRSLSRRLAIAAAAAIVLLSIGISLTEATGVTQVVPTVIRIVTGEGTLVVETDPDVQVTVQGNGDLVFNLAGGQTIRVPTGRYRVRAVKDGKPIPLDKELVTISRGGEQVVRVRLESAAPATATPSTAERGAFVLLGGKGVAERKFDTLADAVERASNGDTIEIRGNGPFLSEPVDIQRTALTIRSGAGFRPVIKLSPEAIQQNVALLTTKAALVLEGLELHRAQRQGDTLENNIAAFTFEAPLRAVNCRFRAPISAWHSPVCEFRNCEFLTANGYGFVGQIQSSSKFTFENCLHKAIAFSIGFSFHDGTLKGTTIQIRRNTFATRNGPLTWVRNDQFPGRLDPPQESAAIGIEVSESVLDALAVVGVEQSREFLEKSAVLEPAADERALVHLIQWRGARNLFATASTRVRWTSDWQPLPAHGPKSLDEWKQFWEAAESDSLEGQIKFQGGNLLAHTGAEIDRLTPDDFRLREDSPGYRALPGGKNLGADVDLVGPGPAYERWKKTPEYQEWRKQTGHGVQPE